MIKVEGNENEFNIEFDGETFSGSLDEVLYNDKEVWEIGGSYITTDVAVVDEITLRDLVMQYFEEEFGLVLEEHEIEVEFE